MLEGDNLKNASVVPKDGWLYFFVDGEEGRVFIVAVSGPVVDFDVSANDDDSARLRATFYWQDTDCSAVMITE